MLKVQALGKERRACKEAIRMTRDEAAVRLIKLLQDNEDVLRALGVDGRFAIGHFPGILALIFTPEAAAFLSMLDFDVDVAPPSDDQPVGPSAKA